MAADYRDLDDIAKFALVGLLAAGNYDSEKTICEAAFDVAGQFVLARAEWHSYDENKLEKSK